MPETFILSTGRVNLRAWKPDDLPDLIRLSGNPEVMRFFPKTQTPEECQAVLERMQQMQSQHNFTYWHASLKETGEFIGFIGLAPQTYEAPFTPCVDIGWRLLPEFWGKGLASEGAKACLEYGLEVLKIPQIVAVAPKINQASIAVMERIGMNYEGSFVHPAMDADSPLQPCAWYLS